jgi:hypothetical protein
MITETRSITVPNELIKYLSKREYFAAMAMQGLIAKGGYDNFVYLTCDAKNIADALIKELNK